ncbi:MAG: carboxypeptidase regulatory-like domain-containing protein [Candidatus Dojkabacteria bacterium]
MKNKATLVVATIILFTSFLFAKVVYSDSVTFTAEVGDTVLILSGYTAPSSLVTFKENQTVIGTTSSDGSGRFTKEFTAQNPGLHTISIFSTDPRNRSTPSINREIVLIGLETTDVDDLLLAPTINVTISGNSASSIVNISGYSKPDTHLAVTINSSVQKVVTGYSDSAGFYEYMINASELEVGDHTVIVDILDNNNVILARSFELQFTITAEMHEGIGQPIPEQPTSAPIELPASSPQTFNPTPQPTPKPPVEETLAEQFLASIKQGVSNVLPPVLVTASIGILALNAITVPGSISIFYGFFIFRFRKKKITRGIVFDSKAMNPVPFTVVRLFSATGQFLKQTVSDLNGKFDFIVDKGKYKIEAKQSGYSTFTDTVEMEQSEGTVSDNVPLMTSASLEITFIDKLRTVLRDNLVKLNTVFVVLGFIFSIVAILFSFTLLNVIIIFLYSFQLIVLILSKRVNRSWGYVYNKQNNERINGAFIRVLDIKEKRQIDVQISDSKGRFGFDLEPGEYYLTVDVPGFKFEDSKEIETTGSGIMVLKFKILSKDNINLRLAMVATNEHFTSTFGMMVT